MQTTRKTLVIASLLWLLFLPLFTVTAFFADCQSNNAVHEKVVNQIMKHNPQYVFIGGDITQNGSRQDEFDAYHRVMKPITDIAEVYPAMGNHDRDTDLFLQNFPQVDSLTYYSVDKDSLVWIILNSNIKLAPGSAQYKWLHKTLEENIDRTVVVMMHHPIFSSGAHGDEKGFGFLLPSLFSKYTVAAVFCGHDHIYERSAKDGIHYVVFGGAGGKLYNNESRNDHSIIFRKTHGFMILNPIDDEMKVTAYDSDNNILDEFSFPIKRTAKP
jgi:3',5'-cyclic AMP phosphodiesterase CpdA